MERLTTNKDKSEMGMYELAHNCCYVKDGEARYRDFEMDMNARDFARNLMTALCDEDLPINDDEFDDEVMENLQYDTFACTTGLIALFYRNLWAMADLRERLKEYEDLEEQRLLLRLPCRVGDMIFVIPSKTNYKLNILNGNKKENRVYKQFVDHISVHPNGYLLSTCGGMYSVIDKQFGETWFLTRTEAEHKLKEMSEES